MSTDTIAPATTTAWHGDPDLKTAVMARMRQHREQDEITQGIYQVLDPATASGYRGCLIGCTLPMQPIRYGPYPDRPNEGWHGRVEAEYGIPRTVAHLLDRIFEGLPTSACAGFAVASIEAIPVGADLSLVTSRLMLDLLDDAEHGVRRHTADGSAQQDAVDTVAALYRRRIAGDEPSRSDWLDARRSAYAAAAYAAAAYAAADAADAAAATAYAEAADAAADAADFEGARQEHWSWLADRLLHHLATAPIAAIAGEDVA